MFVGGIDPTVSEADLLDYFSRFGGISKAEIMRDKRSKLSKGYGFIRCSDQETELLILTLHHEINGRKIDVNKAVEKSQTETLRKTIHSRKLFIENVGDDITDRK